MGNGLFLLRKVAGLDLSEAQIAKEFSKTYFEIDGQGTFVDDDFPRDSGVTEEIMSHTVGWTLFDADWRVLANYARLDTAIKARDGAKVVFSTEVEIEPEDESTSQIGRAARRAAAAA